MDYVDGSDAAHINKSCKFSIGKAKVTVFRSMVHQISQHFSANLVSILCYFIYQGTILFFLSFGPYNVFA